MLETVPIDMNKGLFLKKILVSKNCSEHDNSDISQTADCTGINSISISSEPFSLTEELPETTLNLTSVEKAEIYDKKFKFWPDLDRRLNGIKTAVIHALPEEAIIRNASLFALLAGAALISKRFELSF